MLAHSSRAALLGLVFVVVVLTPWRTNAQDTKITWDNAPAPTRKLYLTEEEFRELLPEKKRPDAGYCPVECSHTLNAKQPNGKPYVSGKWEVDKKTGKADLEYRPGRSTVEKGNPYYCNVSAVYRYAPPAAEQPRPEIVDRPIRRLDMFVLGSLNAPYTAQAIREWKERDAKTRTEQVQNPKSPFYKYRYIPDMGLGLDRNDMYVMTSTNGKSCQVFIELQNAKLWQRVSIFLHLEDGAVSQEQAIAIARESAHIIAKKAFGARPKLDKAKPAGEVGLLNTWITDKAGKTPEEDRRANRVTLGKPFHIVCTYKLPKDYDEISIGYTMTPGQDAVIASRERCKRVKDDSIWWKLGAGHALF